MLYIFLAIIVSGVGILLYLAYRENGVDAQIVQTSVTMTTAVPEQTVTNMWS
ncbi:MAG: hypothetical protein LBH00_04950 [Planctomycetaceae bacterium]|nr:hypothetical protein [Planctomycetaceae bacterium]